MSIGMCSGSAQGTQAHARPFDELHSRNHCQGGVLLLARCSASATAPPPMV